MVFGVVTLLLAVGVVLYVAFPARGLPVPHLPWLGAIVVAPVVFVSHLLGLHQPADHGPE